MRRLTGSQIDRVSWFDPYSPQESRFQATGQLKDLRAHLTRFELVTFAFGGQRSYSQSRKRPFDQTQKSSPGFEPTGGSIWRRWIALKWPLLVNYADAA
jgi:hypothetical protein